MISISNASAVEQEGFLTFDISLLETLPLGQSLTLALEAEGLTAREGPRSAFNPNSNSQNPFDFSAQEFEFSLDDGQDRKSVV